MLTRRLFKTIQRDYLQHREPKDWREANEQQRNECKRLEDIIFRLSDTIKDFNDFLNKPGSLFISQAAVHPSSLNLTQGSNIASANNIDVPAEGNRFRITGTTQINLLSIDKFPAGSPIIVLHFTASLTVAHNQAASGDYKPIMLSGAANFAATANDQLVLQYDTTDAKWFEVSRTVI